jgi:hypothetical protein
MRLLVSAAIVVLAALPVGVHARQTVGWVEHVLVGQAAVMVKAKIDTGAQTSSLNCDCITADETDGKQWVSFTVIDTKGVRHSLSKPVVRIATIKRHYGEAQKRYVVRLDICLGDTKREVEVTLVDRTGFEYPMLIGRNFMQGDFLVDPSNTYLEKPTCDITNE